MNNYSQRFNLSQNQNTNGRNLTVLRLSRNNANSNCYNNNNSYTLPPVYDSNGNIVPMSQQFVVHVIPSNNLITNFAYTSDSASASASASVAVMYSGDIIQFAWNTSTSYKIFYQTSNNVYGFTTTTPSFFIIFKVDLDTGNFIASNNRTNSAAIIQPGDPFVLLEVTPASSGTSNSNTINGIMSTANSGNNLVRNVYGNSDYNSIYLYNGCAQGGAYYNIWMFVLGNGQGNARDTSPKTGQISYGTSYFVQSYGKNNCNGQVNYWYGNNNLFSGSTPNFDANTLTKDYPTGNTSDFAFFALTPSNDFFTPININPGGTSNVAMRY